MYKEYILRDLSFFYLEEKLSEEFEILHVRVIEELGIDYARMNGVGNDVNFLFLEKPRQAFGKQQLSKFTLCVSRAGYEIFSEKSTKNFINILLAPMK